MIPVRMAEDTSVKLEASPVVVAIELKAKAPADSTVTASAAIKAGRSFTLSGRILVPVTELPSALKCPQTYRRLLVAIVKPSGGSAPNVICGTDEALATTTA